MSSSSFPSLFYKVNLFHFLGLCSIFMASLFDLGIIFCLLCYERLFWALLCVYVHLKRYIKCWEPSDFDQNGYFTLRIKSFLSIKHNNNLGCMFYKQVTHVEICQNLVDKIVSPESVFCRCFQCFQYCTQPTQLQQTDMVTSS